MLNIRTYMVVTVIGFAVMFSACDGQDDTADKIDDALEIANNADNEKELKAAQEVFYSLPAPTETAKMLTKYGAKYNEEYLNPINNLSTYATTKSQALNLGVYSADLSFTSMFNQSDATSGYLIANKKLAEELSLMDVVDADLIKRMETNVNNKDSLMGIISEVLMNSNSTLKENDQAHVAALILTGSWIEGLYIAVKISEDIKENEKIVSLIIDQRLSLKTLNGLLKSHEENEDIVDVINELAGLNSIFDKVVTTSSKTEVVKDENGKTIIKNNSTSTLSDKEYIKLRETIIELRNKITNN